VALQRGTFSKRARETMVVFVIIRKPTLKRAKESLRGKNCRETRRKAREVRERSTATRDSKAR
jgi:hypothetical protein